MEKELEMIFKTGAGKTTRLTLDDPRTDVTPAEIQSFMDLMVARNPLNIEGGLSEIVEANIITTQYQPVIFA